MSIFEELKGEHIEMPEKESAELSLVAEGGLKDYEKDLRFDRKELEGKEILDLGSGPTAKFAQDVKKEIKGAEVISFDYSFEVSDESRRVNFHAQPTKDAQDGAIHVGKMTGTFTDLPFVDESFDVVVSHAAMPFYMHTPAQLERAFGEVIRILRKGGKAYLGPVTYTKVVDTSRDKDISKTHAKQSYDEAAKLFLEILEKFARDADSEVVPPVIGKKFNKYYADFDPVVEKNGVIFITKKN